MKLKVFLQKVVLAIMSFAMALFPVPGSHVTAREGESVSASSESGNLKVVVLQGSPYNRGLVHGRTLKKEIGELIKLWKELYIEDSYKVPADKFIANFLKQTNFLQAIKKWTPELLDEVRGISDGAGVDFDTILAYQLGDEIWANGDDVAGGEHCTSIGVNRTSLSPTYVAQNLDIPTFFRGYQTLLHIKDEKSKLESFVLTVPGIIGVNGLNNKSIAITCNTLLKLEYSKDGLPVAFIVRAVLKQKTLKDAVAFINNIKHASGQNYIIGGVERAYSFECSAHKVSEFIPYEGAPITYHTNHPLANDDYSHAYLANLKKRNLTVREDPFYCYRFEALEHRLRNKSDIGVDVIKSTLSSRDHEKKPIDNEETYACSIMLLSSEPELHIAPGRPRETAFKVFKFTNSSGKAKN